MRSPHWPLLSVLVFAFHASADPSLKERHATELLPPSTLVYLELSRPGEFVKLLESPMWKKLSSTSQYQAAWQTPQAQELRTLISFLEQQLGATWTQAVRTLTDGGLYLAFDAATQGAGLLVKTSDPAMRQKLVDLLVEMSRGDAASKGLPDPIEAVDYRGFSGYKSAQGGLVSFGPWLLVTNKEPMAKWVVDSYVTERSVSLAADAAFKAARQSAPEALAGWGYVRVGTLRAVGVGRELFRGRSNNPAAELLAGGVIDALSRADYLTAELKADPQTFQISMQMPYDPATVAPARRFYFAPAGEGGAPHPLMPEGTLLALSTYRDLGAMWLAAPDLFDDNIATQLAQTDSALSNFFGGRSFSQDILGQIQPGLQFIAARQEFQPGSAPVPTIRLPAFAIVFRVKDPQLMRPYMQVAFQTAVSIGNIQATMQGAPTLMIHSETRGDLAISSASYLTMPDEKAMTDAAIYHNFTPSMATVGDYVILSSTRALAQNLAALATQPQASVATADNTLVRLNGPAILAALNDNRSQLVAQQMIKSGVGKSEAQQVVDLSLELLSHLAGAEAKLTPAAGALRLNLGLAFEPVR